MKKHKELYIEIGERIKSSRENVGITQEKLADALGVSSQFVSDVERGVSGPSLYTIICICKHLHVSSDYLLMGIENSSGLPAPLNHLNYLSREEQKNLVDSIRLLNDTFVYNAHPDDD